MTDCLATLLGATSQAPATCPVSRWHQPQLPRALLAGARLGMLGRGQEVEGKQGVGLGQQGKELKGD